ncbi:hypothetical protein [Sphingomonas sp.]|jgi:hypothetical protein|uniref:hypothetical protein n=1 Tax=Sphingomonas sp. TaxID=28214 RepID=UPI0018113524|nr:hypothetical protein [Sphingomonas sp.]MBA4761175.1 hypothetical protein [Sphingomonas sp.]
MTLQLCRLYGLTIASPFPLPGAHPLATAAAPDVTIAWEAETAWRDVPDTQQIPPHDPDAPHVGETVEGDLSIAWRRELQLILAASHDRITVVCTRAKLEFAPTVLVGIGLGLLLHRRGIVCLHGSVIALNGRTFALLGDSGTGKSTAAAALVAHGGTLVSDDIAALHPDGDGFTVAWGCANVRLGAAASTRIVGTDQLATVPWVDKLMWDVSGNASAAHRPAPRLDALYLLGPAADEHGVAISAPIPPARALPRLVDSWYPQGFTPMLTQPRFDSLRVIAERVPMFDLSYPRRWDILPQLIAALSG